MDLTGIHNLRTRPAMLSDLPKLEALISQSMHVLAGRDYSGEQIESALLYLMGVDKRLIDDGTYLVAELDGEIIASGGWSKRQSLYGRGDAYMPDDACLLRPGFDAARLRALFVHPNWARRGLGRLLVHVAEYGARDHGFRSMELLSTRTGVALYESLGYRAIKPVDITLPDGVVFTGILMRKSLVLGGRTLAARRQTITGLFQRIH
jgi:GNAT superfamily N-acetyltransferase